MSEKATYEELEKQVLELKNAERKFKNTEAILMGEISWLRILFEQSRDGIVVLDQNCKVYEANRRYADMLGYSMEEIQQLHVWDWDVQFTKEQLIEMLQSVDDAGAHFETRHRCKDGTFIDVELSNNGAVYRDQKLVFCVCRDITDRKQAEEALRINVAQLNRAMAMGKMGHWCLDVRSDQYVFSDEMYHILGVAKEEFDHKRDSVIGMIHPNDRDSMYEIRQAMREGKIDALNLSHRIIRPDGGVRDLIINAEVTFDEKERPVEVFGTTMDITERKQAEEELKERTAFLDKIIETSALSLWISDEKGTAIRANSACLKFFGATEEEVIGKYNLFQDSVIKTEGFMPLVKGVFENGEPDSFVINYDFGSVDHVTVKNATRKIVKTVLTPVLDSNKKVSNVIVQTIDLTAIKQSEEEKIRVNKILAEHEKLSLVGQVAGKMAHDFNNVLGIIMGNTELALLDSKDAQTKKALELIYDQTIRGKNLTKNLVAFAKDQEPKQEFFRINKKIDLVLDLLKKDLEEIELVKEDKPGVPDLLADPGMIEHAFVNLIQNSIHATSMVENPKIILRTYCLEDNICFEIEDNGCGIPKEHWKDIFEPSFTLKGNKDVTGLYEKTIKGTGYGMSNVKKYIDLHKGSIFFDSKIGLGTKFTIRLPVIRKELTNKEKIKIRDEITYFEKYILLVEDEIALSNIQYKVLTQEPCRHKVDIANSGKAAMDLFDRNEYDFICLDYVLPGKTTGMDVYNYIRKKNQTIPILFISGNIEFLESIKALKQKDVNIDHQSKPCQNTDYVKSINELLKRS